MPATLLASLSQNLGDDVLQSYFQRAVTSEDAPRIAQTYTVYRDSWFILQHL